VFIFLGHRGLHQSKLDGIKESIRWERNREKSSFLQLAHF
jgi:hypothetical protein